MIGLESKTVCVCVFESLQGGTQTDSQGDSIILGRLRWSCLMKVRIEFVVCNNQSAAAYQSSHGRLQQSNAGGSSVCHLLTHSLTQTLLFYIWTLWKGIPAHNLKTLRGKMSSSGLNNRLKFANTYNIRTGNTGPQKLEGEEHTNQRAITFVILINKL